MITWEDFASLCSAIGVLGFIVSGSLYLIAKIRLHLKRSESERFMNDVRARAGELDMDAEDWKLARKYKEDIERSARGLLRHVRYAFGLSVAFCIIGSTLSEWLHGAILPVWVAITAITVETLLVLVLTFSWVAGIPHYKDEQDRQKELEMEKEREKKERANQPSLDG